jgi:hypothetical protein
MAAMTAHEDGDAFGDVERLKLKLRLGLRLRFYLIGSS